MKKTTHTGSVCSFERYRENSVYHGPMAVFGCVLSNQCAETVQKNNNQFRTTAEIDRFFFWKKNSIMSNYSNSTAW